MAESSNFDGLAKLHVDRHDALKSTLQFFQPTT